MAPRKKSRRKPVTKIAPAKESSQSTSSTEESVSELSADLISEEIKAFPETPRNDSPPVSETNVESFPFDPKPPQQRSCDEIEVSGEDVSAGQFDRGASAENPETFLDKKPEAPKDRGIYERSKRRSRRKRLRVKEPLYSRILKSDGKYYEQQLEVGTTYNVDNYRIKGICCLFEVRGVPFKCLQDFVY